MRNLLKSLHGKFVKSFLEFALIACMFVIPFALLWFVFIGSWAGLQREITIFTQCYELSQLHKEGLQ